jgi:hypothetical protein
MRENELKAICNITQAYPDTDDRQSKGLTLWHPKVLLPFLCEVVIYVSCMIYGHLKAGF